MAGHSARPTREKEMNEEFPSISDELNRKTVEELIRIVEWLDDGRYDAYTALKCLETLWQVASGLVPRETTDLYGEIYQTIMLNGEDTSFRRWNIMFDAGGSRFAAVGRNLGREHDIVVFKAEKDTLLKTLDQSETKREMIDLHNNILKRLQKQGFKE